MRFWKGVRDCIYHAGNLDRYEPDGIVERTENVDDQVKIRGLWIELGKIDAHQS